MVGDICVEGANHYISFCGLINKNTWIGWDELGQHKSDEGYRMMFGSLRSAGGDVPTKRVRATANPGGLGHLWVKHRFIDPAPGGYEPMIDQQMRIERMYIPSRVSDNRVLLRADPGYVDRLRGVGSEALVRAWLDGDWDIVEGAYFDNWRADSHVIRPLELPRHWTRFRALDWGSYRPFCVLWLAVSDGGLPQFPRGALVVYREWYGMADGQPNVGLKLDCEVVAEGIKGREAEGEDVRGGVADPAIHMSDGGPSIAERMARNGLLFKPGDNKRIPGWQQIRHRLNGEAGRPMLYVFSTCAHLIRTLPAMQHDEHRPEDLDTDGEDHCFVGDTLVSTDKGVYSLRDLAGTTGFVRSSDGKWHRYRSARMTRRLATVVSVELSSGGTIICTPDHRFLTSKGWAQARDLEGAAILSLSPKQSRNLTVTGIIGVVGISSARAVDCILRFGNDVMGRCRKAIMSITSMAIEPTTAFATSNASQDLSISAGGMARSPESEPGSTSIGLLRRRASGTAAMKGELGIPLTTSATAEISCTPESMAYAPNAGADFNALRGTIGSAPKRANPLGGELPVSMPLKDFVLSAARGFRPTNTPSKRPVLAHVAQQQVLERGPVCLRVRTHGAADVYCLTVPSTGNFALANGVIVSNCADTLRYACMARPMVTDQTEPAKPRYFQDATFNELLAEHDRLRGNAGGRI